jgi:hypothetical protein
VLWDSTGTAGSYNEGRAGYAIVTISWAAHTVRGFGSAPHEAAVATVFAMQVT